MRKVPLAPASKLLRATPARFTGRLNVLGETRRWRWNTCGPAGALTVFTLIGDVEMRCAVGFAADEYPVIKIANASWDAAELASCEFWEWRCHILNTRGARASDAEFFRVAWICLDLPMAQVAPQPEKHHEH